MLYNALKLQIIDDIFIKPNDLSGILNDIIQLFCYSFLTLKRYLEFNFCFK